MKPYLQSIYVYNNYANQHFLIDFPPDKGEDFKHLIITGNNGSGKTTVLNSINKNFFLLSENFIIPPNYYSKKDYSKEELYIFQKNNQIKSPVVELKYISKQEDIIKQKKLLTIYIPTNKNQVGKKDANEKKLITIKDIQNKLRSLNSNTFSKINNINQNIQQYKYQNKQEIVSELTKLFKSIFFIVPYDQNELSTYFLPFLLKLKDEQAYAIADEETKKADGLTIRFKNLEDVFQILYEEPKLKLKHQYKNDRKFFFDLPDGRHIDFNQLSHGHNAVLTMISEIMLNIEAYREEYPEDVNPKGIVVIDEIESHLHLSLQEKILPALIKMFPNMQFIVATHSPAVIASISNVTVYDLSSQKTVNENLTGIPYDVLMKTHFGIESEYSISVTKKLNKVKELLSIENPTKKESEEIEELAKELNELSPDLALDIIVELERKERND